MGAVAHVNHSTKAKLSEQGTEVHKGRKAFSHFLGRLGSLGEERPEGLK